MKQYRLRIMLESDPHQIGYTEPIAIPTVILEMHRVIGYLRDTPCEILVHLIDTLVTTSIHGFLHTHGLLDD
jgi:hypothetical protein